jgi:hypothetical protein
MEADIVMEDEKEEEHEEHQHGQEEKNDPAYRFSCEMVEQVVRSRVSNQGMNDVLKIFHKYYGHFLPENAMPTSWYKLRKLASDGNVPKYVMRDLCPKCDWLFTGVGATCGRCKTLRWNPKKPGTPARQSVYFDMAHALKRTFSVEVMADELVQFAALVPSELGIRDRQLDEAWQGSIMHSMMALVRVDDEDHFEDLSGDEEAAEDDDDSLVPSSESERSISGSESEGSARNSSGTEQDEEAQDEEAQDEDDEDATQDEDAQDEDDEDATRYTIYISMTADGTEVQKNRSFTPVTSKILNLRSGLRSRMSNILLHAVFPESVQDYNMLLHPVALQLRQHRPDGGDPIRIRHPRTGGGRGGWPLLLTNYYRCEYAFVREIGLFCQRSSWRARMHRRKPPPVHRRLMRGMQGARHSPAKQDRGTCICACLAKKQRLACSLGS